MTLYALGLESKDEIDAVLQAVKNGKDIETARKKWSYEEICGMTFRVVLNSNCYSLDENTGLYTDLRDTDAGLRYLYDNGTDLIEDIKKSMYRTQSRQLRDKIQCRQKTQSDQHIAGASFPELHVDDVKNISDNQNIYNIDQGDAFNQRLHRLGENLDQCFEPIHKKSLHSHCKIKYIISYFGAKFNLFSNIFSDFFI
jgi:hypothetical protein